MDTIFGHTTYCCRRFVSARGGIRRELYEENGAAGTRGETGTDKLGSSPEDEVTGESADQICGGC